MTIADIDIASMLPVEGDTDWGEKLNGAIRALAGAVAAVTGMSRPLVECEHCGRHGIVGHSCWSCGAPVRVAPRAGEQEDRYYFPDGHGGGEFLLLPDMSMDDLPRAIIELPPELPLQPSQIGYRT